jgi:hypothetical protein
MDNQSGHFVEADSYKGEGCMHPGEAVEVGNQPEISPSYSTEEIQSQSIPGYPGNPGKMGNNNY